MNPRKKRILIFVYISILLIVCVLGVKEYLSRRDVESDEYLRQVRSLLSDALKEIKEVRGLSPPENVEFEVVTLSWVKENWGRSYAKAEKERILREERIYKALFVIPENASLYKAEIEWAGFIMTAVWQGKIYIVREYFDPWNREEAMKTLLHELTHIIQEKYFSLPERATFDGGKAKAALIEGDACLVEEIYENKTNESLLNTRLFASRDGGLPDSILRLNYFPYVYGLKFVETLYVNGGWNAVNRAYEHPPTTTEQIMHPEKYFNGEEAEDVEEPTVLGDKWQKVRNDRLGEYFILVMLGNWVSIEEAERAAEGWGGDNFTYYEKGADYLITWNITWDSLKDAREFYLSFQSMMQKVEVEEKNRNLWYKHGRYISVKLRGRSTLIVVSTDRDAVERMIKDEILVVYPAIHLTHESLLVKAATRSYNKLKFIFGR
mgnify:CR=1 FL=1